MGFLTPDTSRSTPPPSKGQPIAIEMYLSTLPSGTRPTQPGACPRQDQPSFMGSITDGWTETAERKRPGAKEKFSRDDERLGLFHRIGSLFSEASFLNRRFASSPMGPVRFWLRRDA